jgi:hypothetical protein
MRVNRSLLNWGVFLIALGGIPLAVDQGWLEVDIAGDLGQLWPLILVGIGLGLILRWTPLSWFGGALVGATFGLILGAAVVSVRDDDFSDLQAIIPTVAGRTCAGDEVGAATTSQDGLAMGDRFELELDLWCGEADVSRGTSDAWSVLARSDPDDAPVIDVNDTEGVSTDLRLTQGGSEDFVFLGRQARSDWQVQVPVASALRVQTTLNAATATIDAGGGPVEALSGTLNASDATVDLTEATGPVDGGIELTLNASDGRLLLPADPLSAGITLNASSLVVCVPEAAALRVDYEAVLGSDDLASSGLTEVSDGRWETPGYASGTGIVLRVTNTVSSLSIERPEACS